MDGSGLGMEGLEKSLVRYVDFFQDFLSTQYIYVFIAAFASRAKRYRAQVKEKEA